MTTHAGLLAKGIWRVADPKITLASVASMIVGATAAAAGGPLAWGWLALTVAGIFFFEAAKNMSGEIFDFDSGADQGVRPQERSPFSGGKRVLLDHLMNHREAAISAALLYALGISCGLAIVLLREPRVMVLGAIGAGLAYFYHAPPLKLSYRGFGELAVAVSYGPVIACGTYLVQRQTISSDVALASIPLGLAIAAFLWVNEMPDARADALAGKKTLVVRLGHRGATGGFAVMVAATYAALAALPLFGLPWTVWLGFAGLIPAARAVRRVRLARSVPEVVPAQAWTLLSFLLLAAGTGLGFLLSRLA